MSITSILLWALGIWVAGWAVLYLLGAPFAIASWLRFDLPERRAERKREAERKAYWERVTAGMTPEQREAYMRDIEEYVADLD